MLHHSSLSSNTLYSIPPYKRSPYKGRTLPSDILGRRRPAGFVRESYPIRGGTLWVTCQLRDRPPPLLGGILQHSTHNRLRGVKLHPHALQSQQWHSNHSSGTPITAVALQSQQWHSDHSSGRSKIILGRLYRKGTVIKRKSNLCEAVMSK
jgi:hypothetical protein